MKTIGFLIIVMLATSAQAGVRTHLGEVGEQFVMGAADIAWAVPEAFVTAALVANEAGKTSDALVPLGLGLGVVLGVTAANVRLGRGITRVIFSPFAAQKYRRWDWFILGDAPFLGGSPQGDDF